MGGPALWAAGAASALALAVWGASLDAARPLPQPSLFAALQAASLAGMVLGLGAAMPRAATPGGRARMGVAGLLGWRLAYFPIMVFSGHVASLGEWMLAAAGLPIVVYPVFLLGVAVLHALAAFAAAEIAVPRRRWVAGLLAPAFVMAATVSFSKPADLRLLPDTAVRLHEPTPPAREAEGNPYLPALVAPGYLPHQRVMLLAAGLTYATIPGSPWAETVKAVLEGLFREHPFGSTADRVREHYLAYHSAHFRIGCRRLSDCPIAP